MEEIKDQKSTVSTEEEMEFINLEWLLDHHQTKEKERRQMVSELDLTPGDKVLDLGCGPGLWTPMIAEKVKPQGKVIGVDLCEDFVEFARKNLKDHPLKKNIKFQVGDFNNLSFEDESFDAVFFGNCFAYVTEPNRVLNEMKRVIRKGGKVIGKDFDGAIIIFHPIDPHLSAKVLAAAARGLKEDPPKPYFNNYTGRKMQGLFLEAGLKNVQTNTYAIQKVAPLSPEAKRYITGNAEWYAKMGANFLSESDFQRWHDHFDPSSARYILNKEDFYFCMLEMVTIGKV